MPWPDRLSLRAENLRMDLVVVKDDYLGIRFSLCRIVSVLWHMGGFSETRFQILYNDFKFFYLERLSFNIGYD